MENQQQKAGLKARMGAGYAKFGRNGSVWRWEFTWNDTGRGANGYDNGFLTSNAAIFERLKTRLIYGVLENANYHLKANYFRVYLIDGEDKTKDEHIISLRFDSATENGKNYIMPIFSFTQYAKDELSKASILYLEDVFAGYALKLKGKYIGEKNTVNSLIKQANESVALTPVAKPAQILTQTLQERYNDAVHTVFAENKGARENFAMCVASSQNDVFLLKFNEIVRENSIDAILRKYNVELLKITEMVGFSDFGVFRNTPAEVPKATPNGIPIGNKIQDIQSLIQIATNDKLERVGEVRSFAKLVQKKEATYQKTEEQQAHLSHFNKLLEDDRKNETKTAMLYYEQYQHILNA